MNTEKKIYLALAVLAVLLGGLWLQQRSLHKEEVAHSPESAHLPAIALASDAADKVTKIEIANASKADVILEKDGDKWKVTKPVAAEANQQNVKSLIENLKELKLKETIDSGKTQYASYDLGDDKALHIQVWKGAEKPIDLYFGKSGSRGQMTRLAGRDGVYVASGYSSYLYTREVKNWRNTDVLSFDDGSVLSASLENEHGKYSFTKNDGKWAGTLDGKPIKDFDGDKVTDFVRAFKSLTAEDFGDGKSDAETGLDKPLATVSFTLKDKAGAPTIKFGKVSTGTSHYARKDGSSIVYVISSWSSDWALAAPPQLSTPEAKDAGASKSASAKTAKK